MLDPKILLDALLAGAAKPAAAPQGPAANAVDLGEILRRMGQGGTAGGGQGGGTGGGGLGEILEKLGRAQQGSGAPQAPGGAGGLGDILGEIFGRAGQPQAQQRPGGSHEPDGQMSQGQPQGAPAGGRDMLEEIFGPRAGGGLRVPQANPPQPVPRPSPQQAPQHTPWGGGGSGRVIDARQQAEELLAAIAAGQGTPEMIEQLQDMVARGQINAGAVIGGLGSLVVGNKPGRRINAQAARLGGLELIGAIAYNAYADYKQGRNPGSGQQAPAGPAPRGSGFEAEAQSADAALLYVRAMIAAAAADGEVDRAEQQQIIGGLDRLGLGPHATQFLQQEFESPPTVQDLVQATQGDPATALQTYSAARLAIEPNTRDEQAFLQTLARGLGIDAGLAAHIDAATTSLKV